MTAIVLAGGSRDEVCADDPHAPNKAFVQIGGRALVSRAIDSLRGVARIRRIVAVAPQSAHGDPALVAADEVRASGARIADSLRSGLAGCDPDALVLVAASDLPVLRAATIESFLEATDAARADLWYSCVERTVHEAQYHGVPHTWAHLRDGDYCGGGLIAIRPRAFGSLERFLDRLGRARKNPLRLASIFGYDVLVAYALRGLSVAGAERRASALLGARVRAVASPNADIAVNVDRRTDIELAEVLVRSTTA